MLSVLPWFIAAASTLLLALKCWRCRHYTAIYDAGYASHLALINAARELGGGDVDDIARRVVEAEAEIAAEIAVQS